MVLDLFFAEKYRRQYAMEIRGLVDKHGPEALDVVRLRARDKRLTARDRQHWNRIRVAMSSGALASAQPQAMQVAD
jgi:hypothetical protein